MTYRWQRALGLLAAVSLLGLGACTAILGDFTTSADSTSNDGGPIVDGTTPQGDGGPQNEGGPAPGTFTFETIPTSAFIQPGKTAQIQIAATLNQFSAPITVTVTGLPAGVTAAPLIIAAGAASGQLALTAAASATIATNAKATVAATGGTVTAAPQTLDVTVSGPTGTLDTGFPAAAPFTAALGVIGDALVQPDGKILLFGTFHKVAGDAPSLVMRLNADATVDSTFTLAGVKTAVASPVAFAVQGLLQPDGKILVAWTQGSSSVLNLTRLTATGTLDATWNNPSTATVSTFETFTAASPEIVALAQDDAGAVEYAQFLSGSPNDIQGWRFTKAGIPDSTLGSMALPGAQDFSYTGAVGDPIDGFSSVQSIFPQTGGDLVMIGSGVAYPSEITGQYLVRTTAGYVPDTTFGAAGEKNGWEFGNGKNNPYESVQAGSTIFTATYFNQTCTGSQIGFAVTSFTLGATDITATAGPVYPSATTGLGCPDQAVRITTGPSNTLLVAGYTAVGGNFPVVARYTQSPLAVDTTFGNTGVTKLNATSGGSQAAATPVAVVAAPNGSTLVFNQDANHPIQRVFP